MRIDNNPPPLWYRLVANLPYGRYRVLNYLRRHNKLDRAASFPFHDRTVLVPLYEYPDDLSDYQRLRISTFASLCDQHLVDFDFIDCGANLGLFSAQFTAYSARVKKLTAIEPNSQLFPLLQFNLVDARADQVECLNAAVSDFEGRGRLVEPEGEPSGPHAWYMVDDPAGDVPVITLSRVLANRTQQKAAIKVDVEGAEVAVLCGSADAIRSLAGVVLFVEVHETVLARIGMSDVEMLAEIETIRPFNWLNASDGAPIDPRSPIFDQVDLVQQCDLIGIASSL
jgi:FkbM family methyltransferase